MIQSLPRAAGCYATAAQCERPCGSVRFIARTIDWELMRKLLQKDDGEVVGEF